MVERDFLRGDAYVDQRSSLGHVLERRGHGSVVPRGVGDDGIEITAGDFFHLIQLTAVALELYRVRYTVGFSAEL